jgi:hypothetical protein
MLAFTFVGDGLRDALDPRTEDVSPSADAELKRRRARAEAPQELPKAA